MKLLEREQASRATTVHPYGPPAGAWGDRTDEHPCFKAGCSERNARIHLAVAPRCNISCNYCVRKHDCVNESRPGVTSTVLSPAEAFERYEISRNRLGNLTVVGIAGPGDALADWENTRETFRLIRAVDPDVTFCLSTNGLLLPRHADELVDLGVSHVTVTMNAVDPLIGAGLYRFVTLDGTVHTGEEGARLLLANQTEGIGRLIEAGVCVKVNTVLVSGINECHAEEVSSYIARMGVNCQNITQMIPVAGSVFENLLPVGGPVLDEVRARCAQHIRQIYHCRQCRADAVGRLGEDLSTLIEQASDDSTEDRLAGEVAAAQTGTVRGETAPGRRPMVRVAVASRSGTTVDTHFGHARHFMIYDTDGVDTRYRGSRHVDSHCTGPSGCDDGRDRILSDTLDTIRDCNVVLVLRIGPAPRRELAKRGIRAICTTADIAGALRAAYRQTETGVGKVAE